MERHTLRQDKLRPDPNGEWVRYTDAAELLEVCEELMPILREPLHWRLLVPGERKLLLRIEAAIAKANPQPEVR